MKLEKINQSSGIAVREEGLFVNGEMRAAVSGATFDDFNPTTGELYARVADAGVEDASMAIEAAQAATRTWQQLTGSERENVLWRAASALEEQSEEFVEVLIDEAGSTVSKARSEVSKSVDLVRAAAGDVRRVEGKTTPSAKCSFSIRQPVGVVVAITPWNVPLTLAAKKVALGLSAGNTLVLKPSPLAPVIAVMLGRVFDEAGLPPGALNVIPGPGKPLGDLFVAHPDVKTITFTGSTATGKYLAGGAAANLKRFGLELGGKNPAIVLRDADLERAAQAIVFSAFYHSGQNCMAASRVIVEGPCYEEMVERLGSRASNLKVGDPRSPETHLGPIINDEQLQRVHRLVTDSIDAGARLMCGGTPDPPFYPATVVADVRPGMSLFEEETFGPVAAVIQAEDAADALQLANNSRYGLSAGIFTRDIQKGLKLAQQLEVGMVHINDSPTYTEPTVPFGGVKESGYGREGSGGWAWQEMTESKWITVQLEEKQFPF